MEGVDVRLYIETGMRVRPVRYKNMGQHLAVRNHRLEATERD